MANRTGVTFSIPNKYGDNIFGRIIFDSLFFQNSGLLAEQNSHLTAQNTSLLIEVYELTEGIGKKTVMPGVITSAQRLEKNIWKETGRERVDPRTLNFPEFVSIRNPQTARFHKGEVLIDFQVDGKWAENLKLFPGNVAAINLVDMFYFTKGELDKIDKIFAGKYDALDLSKYDLRFSPFRKEIYDLIGEDVTISYFDLSKKHGVDIERLKEYF